jgi:hypothetical protein
MDGLRQFSSYGGRKWARGPFGAGIYEKRVVRVQSDDEVALQCIMAQLIHKVLKIAMCKYRVSSKK